jgi:thioester reductase-like protein
VSVFLTGFPGFLGSELVDRLLDRADRVDCLVQPAYREAAEARAAEIAGPEWRDRVRLYEGDVTDPSLGLDAERYGDAATAADEVFHLAAVYDLSVSRDVGERVNVDGTEHVLDFAEAADADRFQHVSTCYVSGRHDGVFRESDLAVGQSFTNHYEETKFRAEVAVRDRMAEGLPATVYRPAIVVGDSETGATQKYDGPYYLIRFLLRQPRVAVLPLLGAPDETELNVVPRDYVVDAIAELSAMERAAGVTYHLCDPNPPTVREAVRLLADAADRRLLAPPVPEGLLRRVLSLPRARDLTGVDPAVLPYFTHPTRYVAGNARRDLTDADVSPPPFASYVSTAVDYVRANPSVGSEAMN